MRREGESENKQQQQKSRIVDENSKNDILKRKIESFVLEEKSSKGYWMGIWGKKNLLSLEKRYIQREQGISRSVLSDSLQSHGLYLPGSSAHEPLQAGILVWVAISSFMRSSWLNPHLPCRQILYHLSHLTVNKPSEIMGLIVKFSMMSTNNYFKALA